MIPRPVIRGFVSVRSRLMELWRAMDKHPDDMAASEKAFELCVYVIVAALLCGLLGGLGIAAFNSLISSPR